MLIKTFTIPILGGESTNEELNVFLKTKRILNVDSQMIISDGSGYWCFCIKYLEGKTVSEYPRKIDYKEILDDKTFKKFSELRVIRKELALKEGVPAYAIFTDQELSEIAKLDVITAESLKKIDGIGEKKLEKYGKHFITEPSNEESQ